MAEPAGGAAGRERAGTAGSEVAGREPAVQRVPLDEVPWDETVDVVVAGSGAAGLTAALAAAEEGASVLVLEKAANLGGTTALAGSAFDGERAGTWVWICNNALMREAGIDDPRPSALAYMARLAHPEEYRRDAEGFGLPPAEHELLAAFYDHGQEMCRELADLGVLDWFVLDGVVDYFSDLEENAAPHGRSLAVRARDGGEATGAEIVESLAVAAAAREVEVRTSCPLRVVVADEDGVEVGGVLAGDRAASARLVRARGGVVAATGGFGASGPLRRTFLRGPIAATLAAPFNTGDLLTIAGELGAPLANMSEAWLTPLVLDRNGRPAGAAFRLPGDSMLVVNRYGRRVVNEKTTYNEMTRAFFVWDADRGEYPNLPLFLVYDEWVARTCRRLPGDAPSFAGGGNPLAPSFEPGGHELRGDSLEGLAEAISRRLAQCAAHLGDLELDAQFLPALRRTLEDFAASAADGHDRELGRGSTAVQRARSGPSHREDQPNPTMHALADAGPYYAVLLVPGALDTRGGPAIDVHGRVRGRDGEAIHGLYAAGNCAGSPSGQGYFGGGATIGLGMTFGWLAGRHAARRAAERSVAGRR